MRKLRDAARKAGPLRFEPQTDDPAVFQAMVRWKTEQYRRTGVTNVLGFDWTIALLQRILATRGEAFGGMMSALYLGDALATVLFSMRSYDVVHGWFSAYCPDFATLSPGQILWIELAKAYPAIGIRRVELGKGPESYKRHLMSGATEVAEGVVDFRPVVNMMRRSWHRVYDWARQSPLRRPLLAPGRFLRTLIESRRFR
jgi:CelD/BcsL family acetyltransferase involved in cellulose biosynthesis